MKDLALQRHGGCCDDGAAPLEHKTGSDRIGAGAFASQKSNQNPICFHSLPWPESVPSSIPCMWSIQSR
jgi:hypothetical protein